MNDRELEAKLALLRSSSPAYLIHRTSPYISCVTYDVKQLGKEITTIFEAKASLAENGSVTAADAAGVFDEIAEFEKQSIYFCTDVRAAARSFLHAAIINRHRYLICRPNCNSKFNKKLIYEQSYAAEALRRDDLPSSHPYDNDLVTAISKYLGQNRVSNILSGVVTQNVGIPMPSLVNSSTTESVSPIRSSINGNGAITKDKVELDETKSDFGSYVSALGFDEYITQQNPVFSEAVERATAVIAQEIQKALTGTPIDPDRRTKVLDVKEDVLESLNTSCQAEMLSHYGSSSGHPGC